MANIEEIYQQSVANNSVDRKRLVSKAVTFTGSNTTVSTPLFTVTGVVQISALWGVVTTALGAAHTAAHWRINDQTAQPVISLVTGTTLSAAPAGSFIFRRSLVSVALILASSAAGAVSDPVAATAPDIFMPFIVTQKTGGVLTNIEYTYTTTETPTTGAMTFFARWTPLGNDAGLVAA